jgi:hypothetical protein
MQYSLSFPGPSYALKKSVSAGCRNLFAFSFSAYKGTHFSRNEEVTRAEIKQKLLSLETSAFKWFLS